MIQVLQIIILILELITKGMSKDEAITSMSNKYDIGKEVIEKRMFE
jgi:hypothetical protein